MEGRVYLVNMQRQRLIAPIIKTAYLFHHISGQNFNRTHYKKGGQKIQTDPPVPGPAPCKLQYPRKLLRGSHKPVNQQHYHTISDQKRCIHIPVIHKPFGQNDPGVLDQKSQKRYQREHSPHRLKYYMELFPSLLFASHPFPFSSWN